jgi:DNA repair protein RecO (recombination protein O)
LAGWGKTYREEAIVLRGYRLGEADRVLVLLTRGRGKVRAVAKGVRKAGSRWGGRLEPLTRVDLLLYQGRELDVVTQAEVVQAFPRLRSDYPALLAASAMAEAASLLAPEGERVPRIYALLLAGLELLEEGRAPAWAVSHAFALRFLAASGFAPSIGSCAGCGRPGRFQAFSPTSGGSFCPRCAPPGSLRPSPRALELLAHLAGSPWTRLGEGDFGPEARAEAAALVRAMLEHFAERPARALGMVAR